MREKIRIIEKKFVRLNLPLPNVYSGANPCHCNESNNQFLIFCNMVEKQKSVIYGLMGCDP